MTTSAIEPAGLPQDRRPAASGYDDGKAVNTYTTEFPYPVTINLAAIGSLLTP